MVGHGRLVQLVRILGRHPRGRRFEFCTAHQNTKDERGELRFSALVVSKSEKGTNGYDTANYNDVVGESLDAVGCAFVRENA